MPRQLNIRSDEAFETARRLARLQGKPVTDVVVSALRAYDAALSADAELTAEQMVEFEALRQISRAAAKFAKSSATSDHSDMYDASGLPR
ncbi:type II toxin-antitoxin system VapB family antitoxin [Xanthobacter oligotrophicus]|uniref:Type II toxin-antitoxin system VapB family antitoxin n=1 Tax=Xanthobacter oligotrophicus TaxID=2607286 RepID=A0ABW6ZZN3_9HYPH